MLKDSSGVITFLTNSNDWHLKAFSVDIKDLYYSLPQDELLKCVEDCSDSFGIIAFQTASGISQGGFLELLTVYLRSTFACWEDNTFLQKAGVCIGSCIAPVLSNLYLAHRDRILSRSLDASSCCEGVSLC
ncbi:unnamed protein product [Ixodes persulcatus]